MKIIKDYGQLYMIYRGVRTPIKNTSDAEIVRAAKAVDEAKKVATHA